MEIPRLFGGSSRAKSEFPDYPPVLRTAISLGRLLRDPLEEICAACANSRDLAGIHLHPLQDMLGEEYFSKAVHRAIINVVTSVGVDINRCVMHKFASAPLQFVAGLGPRKALGILNAIYKKGGRISSRDHLTMHMDHCVFTNCAGFIRIIDKYFKKNEEIDVRDNTRIHPEDYNLVMKMAIDALEKDCDDGLIADLMRESNKLDDLDLDQFADELERIERPKKKSALYDIKNEMMDPFSDPRNPYRDPDPNELFNIISGETQVSLKVGINDPS
jgi:transcription elongation factor SPT6